MRSIDIHAHLMPQCLWRTVDSGGDWYGMRFDRVPTPKVRFTPEERLRDMDAQGVDVQVVSIHTPLFGYGLEPALGRRLARDVNVLDLVDGYPRINPFTESEETLFWEVEVADLLVLFGDAGLSIKPLGSNVG